MTVVYFNESSGPWAWYCPNITREPPPTDVAQLFSWSSADPPGGYSTGFCSRLLVGHECEPMSAVSAIFISFLGIYTNAWQHNEPSVRFVGALYIINGLASMMNHSTAFEAWSFVDGMTMTLIVWMVLGLVVQQYIRLRGHGNTSMRVIGAYEGSHMTVALLHPDLQAAQVTRLRAHDSDMAAVVPSAAATQAPAKATQASAEAGATKAQEAARARDPYSHDGFLPLLERVESTVQTRTTLCESTWWLLSTVGLWVFLTARFLEVDKGPIYSITGFGVPIILTVVILYAIHMSSVHTEKSYLGHAKQAFRYAVWGACIAVAAAVVWIISESGCANPVFGAWGHLLWHVFMAYGLGLVLLYVVFCSNFTKRRSPLFLRDKFRGSTDSVLNRHFRWLFYVFPVCIMGVAFNDDVPLRRPTVASGERVNCKPGWCRVKAEVGCAACRYWPLPRPASPVAPFRATHRVSLQSCSKHGCCTCGSWCPAAVDERKAGIRLSQEKLFAYSQIASAYAAGAQMRLAKSGMKSEQDADMMDLDETGFARRHARKAEVAALRGQAQCDVVEVAKQDEPVRLAMDGTELLTSEDEWQAQQVACGNELALSAHWAEAAHSAKAAKAQEKPEQLRIQGTCLHLGSVLTLLVYLAAISWALGSLLFGIVYSATHDTVDNARRKFLECAIGDPPRCEDRGFWAEAIVCILGIALVIGLGLPLLGCQTQADVLVEDPEIDELVGKRKDVLDTYVEEGRLPQDELLALDRSAGGGGGGAAASAGAS